jgi:CheY-like chemotaxis protein
MEQILIVEDNKQILSAGALFLQMNDFKVFTALNGKEALDLLEKLDSVPDLILSDIMMPVMNGYDFYKVIIENPKWSHIPFIFLTAKSDPEDIRFGKLLGVDDYITKPFNEDDLLASIRGKITRSKRTAEITATLARKFHDMKIPPQAAKATNVPPAPESIFVFSVFWDDTKGPNFTQSQPGIKECPFPLRDIGVQLFDVSSGIFGMMNRWNEPEGALLRVPSINMDAYVYFDSYPSKEMRGGVQAYMLGVIALKIHYLKSSQLKEVCAKYSKGIKSKKPWKITDLWQDCTTLLLQN